MFKNQKPKIWARLDNAAKIFPSTSRKSDTNVFRFSCILKENIKKEPLQKAVEKSVKIFPGCLYSIRKGLFWYYLEERFEIPKVAEEFEHPCDKIYYPDKKSLLFKVTYFHKRINIEIYHVLADGTGALEFLKDIVYNYLVEVHKEELSDYEIKNESNASAFEKNLDGFRKYYKKNLKGNSPNFKSAFHLHGGKRNDNHMRVIEGIVSCKSILEIAHKYNTTMTVYLTAVFLNAIYKTMNITDQKKDVVISVPVNLRTFFPTDTIRNFFCLMEVPYNFSESGNTIEEIIPNVSKCFSERITKEALERKMNTLAALEHNPFAKIVPLSIKNPVLKVSRMILELGNTAVISNVGKIKVLPQYEEYIDYFSVLSSTWDLQICMCSFGDNLQIGFTSAYLNTEVEKNFFNILAEQGITAKILTNEFNKTDGGVENA